MKTALIIIGVTIALVAVLTFLIFRFYKWIGLNAKQIYEEDIQEIETLVANCPVCIDNYRMILSKLIQLKDHNHDVRRTTKVAREFNEKFKRYGRKRA